MAPAVRFADELPARADVAIIGGGVVGAATAFFAVRAGLRVVLLERRPALATLTTPVSAGAFRLQFDNPDEVALVREGIELFDAFAARTGLDGWDVSVRHGGYLFCSLTDATLARSRRLVDRQREWGLDDVELLSGDEARRRWAYLSPDVRGARYRAADGWLDPRSLAIGYATAASNTERIPAASPGGAATFVTGCEVTGFDLTPDGSRVIGLRTSRGQLAADGVVVAAGPFSGVVAGLAGASVQLKPVVRHKLVLPELPQVPADAPMTIEEETAAHWRPAMAGCLALWTDAAASPAEPADPVPPDPAWAFGLLDPASDHALARLAPFWREVWNGGAPTAQWYLMAGQYEVTPDRRPYLGPIGREGPDGLFLNGGHSGHGIMASAGGSRLVVDLITGVADASTNPFAPDRPMAARVHDIL